MAKPLHCEAEWAVILVNSVWREAEMVMKSMGSNFPLICRFGAGLWVAVALVAGLAWAAGQVMSVQVRTSNLRVRPSFLGTTISKVTYGTQVTVDSRQGPWVKVTVSQGQTGWLHESALSEKELAMVSGETEAATGASGEEIALAGKGFSDQVEQEYRQQNQGLDYQTVDRIEKIVVTPEQAVAFLAAGQVKPAEGGR
jgi:uncharacterized protein YgiM (DUF1202 family)